MTKIHKIMIILAVICTLVLIFPACTQEEENNSTPNNIWFIDNNIPPMFHTNNITIALQETPFELVLPTYLPDGLDPEQPDEIVGPYKTTGETVEIHIYYPKITIIEIKSLINQISNSSTSYYFEINETKVLRENGGKTIIRTNKYIPCIMFTWNLNGIFFKVVIDDIYNDNEYLKIIESMIR